MVISLRLLWPAGLALSAVALAGLGASCQHGPTVKPAPEGEASFAAVKPVLQNRCLPCHQGYLLGAKVLDLRTPGELLDQSRQPPLLVPGKPEKSRFYQVIALEEEVGDVMPPLGHGVSAEEKGLIREWIRQGAPWPEGEVLESAAVADMKKTWQ